MNPPMAIQQFIQSLDVRFLDMNAGNHLSNHTAIGYITDFVSEFLITNGHSLTDVHGHSVLFTKINAQFLKEVVYPANLTISVESAEVKSRKLLISFVGTVNDKAHIKCEHEICFLKDGKVIKIGEDIAALFGCEV